MSQAASSKISLDKWIVILTVASASLLQSIDTSIVNVALTTMMGNLGATLSEIGWVITSYAAANVIMIALAGWMGARFGRKRYFAMSIILFTVASVACGLSTNVWELVFFRFLQGIGGGGIMTTAQSIIVETFPREQLGFANGIYGMTVIIGPAVGPTLGGYITDTLSWNWTFFINLPIGIFATLMTMMYVKEPEARPKIGAMDWWGLLFLVMGIGSLQILLERGQDDGWFDSPLITALAMSSVVGVGAFLWRSLKIEFPIVNLRLFRNYSFAMGCFFGFIQGFGLYSSIFIVPRFTQVFLGLTATASGLMLMPSSLITAAFMPIVGKATRKFQPKYLAIAGMVLFMSFCFSLTNLHGGSSQDEFFWPLVMRGIGMSLLFIPLTNITLSDLQGTDLPQGSGLSNMIRQLGGSFGIAIMTAFLSYRSAVHRSHIAEHINVYHTPALERFQEMVAAFQAKGYALVQSQQMALASLNGVVAKQAALLSNLDAFRLVGVFFAVGIPILLLYKQKHVRSSASADAPPVHMD